ELCILLYDYWVWERLNLKIPIYFSAGLTIQTNMYYKMLNGRTRTSQNVKDSYATKNAFNFKHEKNLITLPGYCLAGTVGHKLISGRLGKIFVDKETLINIKWQIHQLSFSPHKDAKGITDLVKFPSLEHVILIHGEKPKRWQH
ncbi:hypothetical protein MKW98_014124, partial [Papaver atlanticum]